MMSEQDKTEDAIDELETAIMWLDAETKQSVENQVQADVAAGLVPRRAINVHRYFLLAKAAWERRYSTLDPPPVDSRS